MMIADGLYVLLNYRAVKLGDNLFRHKAHRRWSQLIETADKLYELIKDDDAKLQLGFERAYALAAQGGLYSALSSIEEWSDYREKLPPGGYESRLSAIYLYAGDYEQCLHQKRQAFILSSEGASETIDLAFAEACYGDINQAQELLTKLRYEELQAIGKPFVKWIKGMIALDNNEPSAVDYFDSALAVLLEYQKNPVFWGAIAELSGYYAVALYDNGERNRAEELVNHAEELLDVNALPKLRRYLEERGLLSPVFDQMMST